MGSKKANWTNAPVRGFAQKKTIYKEGENPFTDGTCRFIPTKRKKKKNKDQVFAERAPTLPATGKYAVYVSYQTLHNSVSAVSYKHLDVYKRQILCNASVGSEYILFVNIDVIQQHTLQSIEVAVD